MSAATAGSASTERRVLAGCTVTRTRAGTSLSSTSWVRAAEREIREANERTDRLLRRILPDPVVEELTREGSARPMRHRDVSILFCDLAGFTAWCDSRAPEEVVDGLSRLIECFEEVVERHGLQKIKTIGDAYVVCAGALSPCDEPEATMTALGLQMCEAVAASK